MEDLPEPKFKKFHVVKWEDLYTSPALKVGLVKSVKQVSASRTRNPRTFYRIELINDPRDKRIHTVPEEKLSLYIESRKGSSVKNVTMPSLKETFMREEQEEEKNDFGKSPILTDYHSMKEVQASMRKKVYEALKTGDARAVTQAVEDAVLQGARFGYVTGWDKAWTEAQEGSDASHIG